MKIVQKKICLLGDYSVGKTSLIRQYVEERFDETYISTIGVHMSRKRLKRSDHLLDFFIWDLAGGEDFNTIGRNYLLGAAGALIVCDITRSSTLSVLTYYAEQMRSINEKAALVFIGNKVDLVEDATRPHDDLQTAITSFSNSCLLTSAKTGHNVNSAFAHLADKIES